MNSNLSNQQLIDIARATIAIESDAILKMSQLIDNDFALAVHAIYQSKGRVIVTE